MNIPDIESIELTERQEVRLLQWKTEGCQRGLSSHSQPYLAFSRHHPRRPDRGHDVHVFWADGERIMWGFMDVYGNGWVSFGEVEWDDNDEN